MNRETATGKANSLLHTDEPQPGLAVHRFRVEADAVIFDGKAQNSADREEQDRGVLASALIRTIWPSAETIRIASGAASTMDSKSTSTWITPQTRRKTQDLNSILRYEGIKLAAI